MNEDNLIENRKKRRSNDCEMSCEENMLLWTFNKKKKRLNFMDN